MNHLKCKVDFTIVFEPSLHIDFLHADKSACNTNIKMYSRNGKFSNVSNDVSFFYFKRLTILIQYEETGMEGKYLANFVHNHLSKKSFRVKLIHILSFPKESTLHQNALGNSNFKKCNSRVIDDVFVTTLLDASKINLLSGRVNKSVVPCF